MTNSRLQGGVGIGAAIAYFMKCEIPVFVPLVDYSDYDLVIDLNGLQKVQVRTSTYCKPNGNYAVNMKISGGNAKHNKISKSGTDMVYDYLFVHLGDGRTYLIPKFEIAHIKSNIIMGVKYEKFRLDMQAVKAGRL